jgi:aldehyde:ferredoxin oxidoreductase
MGSKGLKAIAIDGASGQKPPITDRIGFKRARKAYHKALLGHPQTTTYKDYGTAAMGNLTNTFRGLPTRNFSSGQFEGIEKVSGEALRQAILDRDNGGDTSHACMRGCSIQCSNVYVTLDGETEVSPIEYETIGLMGSNLGQDDLDAIARLNYQVNDLGLDSIEIGAALGIAAEAGLLEFGDAAGALALMDEIRAGTPLGRIIGNGAATTGKVFGIERVPAVKGQAISAYDPRAIKGTGVTYATSPQGADHTCGLTIRANIDHLDPDGQVVVSRIAQLNAAGYDSLGICVFAAFGFGAAPQTISELLNCRYGWQVGDHILQDLGSECIQLERKFNQLVGFTPAADRLPEWMTREPLPPHNSVFDVPDEEMDRIFE